MINIWNMYIIIYWNNWIDSISSVILDAITPYVPQLPPMSQIKFGAKKKDRAQEMVSRKVATVTQFGIAAAATDTKDDEEDGNGDDQQTSTTQTEAFHVSVLNLVESLCNTQEDVYELKDNNDEKTIDDSKQSSQKNYNVESTTKQKTSNAIQLFAGKRSLTALLRLLWYATPRTRVVAIRILRHILSSNVAPSIDVIDECVINALKDENPTKNYQKRKSNIVVCE